MSSPPRPLVAFGPVMPGWGSWEWLGADLSAALAGRYSVETFTGWKIPPTADAVVVVKHAPPREIAEALPGVAILYLPVDFYGAVREIASDAPFLRRCDRVVIPCERLRQFFTPYAEVQYLDHHIKYFCEPNEYRPGGPVLWTGVRTNLPAVASWVNEHGPPGELWILTNTENSQPASAEAFGFRQGTVARIDVWSPQRHREWAALAGAAFDVKAEDFRSRHKSPAKALDFVASGLPLAMNPGTYAVEHLAKLSLSVPTPHDRGRWRSREYWEETQQLARRLREELTLSAVADRLAEIIDESLRERGWSHQAESWNRRRRLAIDLASFGQREQAEAILQEMIGTGPVADQAAINNDIGALAAAIGDEHASEERLRNAIGLDDAGSVAAENLGLLKRSAAESSSAVESSRNGAAHRRTNGTPKIALASFLFNWPSTGGGITHTVELGKFLQAAGYEVRHFFTRNSDYGVGRCDDPLPYEATPIDIDQRGWRRDAIAAKFRMAVARFAPDRVIVTDSWNTKPILADALKDWPCLLRFQALECLCPLNNIRLLPDAERGVRQCDLHQLEAPHECQACVNRLGNHAGSLHQIERGVAGYGTRDYDETLRRVLREAHATLVVNPLMEEMLRPFASRIVVCPAGMDPARFPTPQGPPVRSDGIHRVLFAGLSGEFIKGHHVLRTAGSILWERRRDFRIIATTDRPPDAAPFEEFIGWQSQSALPMAMAEADVIAVPAIAQEAIGRTAVEGMAAGRAVVASRIGGLPFALGDSEAGVFFEPGDPHDLAASLERVFDDRELRIRLGRAGRKRFEERFAWPGIIERQYRPLIEDEARTRAKI